MFAIGSRLPVRLILAGANSADGNANDVEWFHEVLASRGYVDFELGHASITITVDIYGHPRQGTSMALADQLDAPMEQARQSATSTQLTRQSSG